MRTQSLKLLVLPRDYLTERNADDLLAVIAHKTRRQIEQLVAERFPKPDVPTRVRAIAATPTTQVPDSMVEKVETPAADQSAPRPGSEQVANPPAPGRVNVTIPEPGATALATESARSSLTPLAPQRFALQVTIDQQTHDALRHAQELIGHADVAEVIKRALGLLVTQLEKRKYAETSKPRPARQRSSANPRNIPAYVKRAVRRRDQDQCTFRSESGQRCAERNLLEFDHVQELARGGEATVDNIRLRCRSHNQYTAECTFGAGFMDEKRREARERAETKRSESKPAPASSRSAQVPVASAGTRASLGAAAGNMREEDKARGACAGRDPSTGSAGSEVTGMGRGQVP